jgi:hypothetical protein
VNIFAFDIETVPDIAAGRRLYGLEGLSDREVANVMFQMRRQETGGSEFLRLHLQRVVAISGVLCTSDRLRIWSLGELDSSEKELVQRFFDGIEKYTPTLVSWNGSSFDLPVLHYRALIHGITAQRYWECGEEDQTFRWNSYINRFHWRHTDLMDVLSLYQARAAAPLDEIAVLLGLPGKMGKSGGEVWESFQQRDLEGIRNYCETDALNTYLIYLRFELMRGHLDGNQYARECRRVREALEQSDKPHLKEFAEVWQNRDKPHTDVCQAPSL